MDLAKGCQVWNHSHNDMLTRFHIENFKSLVIFDLPPNGHELGAFTCLIGLNGSGKSTLLQAFDFTAHVATGDVEAWLARRDWKKADLGSNLGPRKALIMFAVELRTRKGIKVEWHARFNITQLKCTMETIKSGDTTILRVEEGTLSFRPPDIRADQKADKVLFEYHGSILSALKLDDMHADIREMKTALQSLHSLELLAPQLLRRKARAAQDIGAGGEKLSPFLDQLPGADKHRLLVQLQDYYPHLVKWNVKGYRAGWKSLRMQEDYAKTALVEAGHINDGFLRVIAILSQAFTEHEILLLDEIENGVNPSLVEKLMDFIVGLGKQGKQVIVTTHSPVILNFLEDAVAREGVMLLYKTDEGESKACRYFDLPETSDKLRGLGPGEVFVDTDLVKLSDRLGKAAQHAAAHGGASE
jgi:predicted ATPase